MDLSAAESIFRLNSKIGRYFTAIQHIPGCSADPVAIPVEIQSTFRMVLAEMGIQSLYRHQEEVFRACLDGHNVVVATPTASGKTLCYNLPVIHRRLVEPESRALYLFPTKALAQDQFHNLVDLNKRLDGVLSPETYDGDTPAASRPRIRRQVGILLTNPDMLHAGILPHHTRWSHFFASLKTIVIDELHHYRGVFGSHLCNVLRRLKRVCRFYGGSPQFIMSSATLANPRELAERMIEDEVFLVERSGAPSGEKLFLFFNPPVVDYETGMRRSYLADTIMFASKCIEADVRTIVFARSRRNVEIIVRELKRIFSDFRENGIIRGYRGGYLPSERRRIERDLRQGAVKCVVATSALELGIDIGDLEVSILSGYPGTIAGAWQRAGRAGRREGFSAALYIASAAPLDQFIVKNPNYFFRTSPEYGLINPDNLLIVMEHLRCSLAELPLEADELFGSFKDTKELLLYLESEREARFTNERWFFTGSGYPADQVSLRSASPESVVILEKDETTLKPIAEVDRSSAPMLVHPDAIYMHAGTRYLVLSLDLETLEAVVKPVEVDYFTVPLEKTSVSILETEVFESGDIGFGLGDVEVFSQVAGYKKIKFTTMENVGYGDVSVPGSEMMTTGTWMTLNLFDVIRHLNVGMDCVLSGILGAMSAMHSVAAVMLMSDPKDLGSTATDASGTWSVHINPFGGYDIDLVQKVMPDDTLIHLFFYDRYPGGIGLCEHLFDMRHQVAPAARGLIRECECRSGCPGCVGPVEFSECSVKSTAVLLLDYLIEKTLVEKGKLDDQNNSPSVDE